jgi:tetratricopeptide (TPR) repeat protein
MGLSSRTHAQLQAETTSANPIDPEREIAALKKEELELAEKIIKDFPDNANALILMGNVLERHGEAVKALERFEEAIKLDPHRPSVYESIGWFYLHKGQYEQAISHWQKALKINPELPGMHNNIARALMGLGRPTEAIEELEKDIQISPQAGTSHFLLGQLYLQQEAYEKAREHYEKAIAIEPNHTNAYYGLFTLSSRLKDNEKARQYMATFRKLKAEDMKVLKDRNNAFDDLVKMQKGAAETFMRAGQMYETRNDLQRVEKLLNRAVALDPNNTTSLHRLAYVYVMSNRVGEALQTYKKVNDIDPSDTFCHLNIGLLSARLNQFADAEKAFLRVIELAPEASNGYRELAQLYLRTGQKLPAARELAEKAVALEPVALNYFVLSWACDVNGDSESGLTAITRALQLEPDNMRYKKIYEHIKNKK